MAAATTMEAATVEATTVEATTVEATAAEAAASGNNSMPRHCVRRGPMPRPSMRRCTPARSVRSKYVPPGVLLNSGRRHVSRDRALRWCDVNDAARVATRSSIIGPGLRPRRRQYANVVT